MESLLAIICQIILENRLKETRRKICAVSPFLPLTNQLFLLEQMRYTFMMGQGKKN